MLLDFGPSKSLREFLEDRKTYVSYHGNADPSEVTKLIRKIQSGKIKNRSLVDHVRHENLMINARKYSLSSTFGDYDSSLMPEIYDLL